MAALGAVEAIGLLGLALAQAEGVLLTFFFLLAVLPVLLLAALGATLAVGLFLSLRERRSKRSRRTGQHRG
jgi:hypothetical protein